MTSSGRWGSATGDRGRKSDDMIREPVQEAEGETVIYRRRREAETVREWVEQHQLLALGLGTLGVILLAIGVHYGVIGDMIDAVPPWGWSIIWYVAWGAALSALPAYLVLRRVDSPQGHEILDLDPVTQQHRHVRIGRDLWEDFRVTSPWTDEVSVSDLQECSVNGRSGYEVMDLRVPEDGPPTAVVPWLGDCSASEFRTYKYSYISAHQRLSRLANKSIAKDATRPEIVRECAERVVHQMVRTSERSGMPNGDEIADAVDDVLGDLGVSDTLRDDDLDDIDPWQPGDRAAEGGGRSAESGGVQRGPDGRRTNGHDDDQQVDLPARADP